MLIYRAEMYILMKYPYLIDINKKNSGVSSILSEKSPFYIIKSFSEEDVHKVKSYRMTLGDQIQRVVLYKGRKPDS